jgi:hypothetical protein
MKTWLPRAAAGVLMAVLVLGLITARAIALGEAEMASSDASFNEGDLPNALLHARRAAVLYAPGAPHVSAAYERMTAIATGAEASGNAEIARSAWRAIRGDLIETQHVVVPDRELLERANRNLARLEADELKGRALSKTAFPEQRADYERALRELGAAGRSRTFGISLLLLGLMLWFGGLTWFVLRAFVRGGSAVHWARARIGLILACAGAACWTVAVLRS